MDLMQRRRQLMGMQEEPEELYPIGTDICDYYGFKDTATTYTSIDTQGELYSVSSANYWTSANYAEINPKYTYEKKYYRLYRIAFYDKNKTFISITTSMGEVGEGTVLPNIPANARYVRIVMFHPSTANYYRVGLVRTA